ncbi:MAG: glycosyltransferase family 2 protein [Lachnospiraceae bacterium]|nr:glycosyltransferase family 2 protein [Lachnospiraceae bacterium]
MLNQTNEILVSVIIPAYNCEKYISKAIYSALSQDVPLEVLVLNDCATDGTEAAVRPYLDNPEVRYIKNEQNMGVAKTRNRGVQLARGKYVAFLDSDDWWEHDKLKKQLARIEAEKVVLCCTGRDLMNPDGSFMGKYIPVSEKITYRSLLKHNCINCSSVLLRRDVALEFPMDYEDSHEDYITWLKILKKYGCACGIDEPLLKYRLSTTGKSGSKFKSAGMTWKVYRYMGFGPVKSLICFCSYAIHGLWKYR